MPAYWVARAKINDPAEYKKYTDQVPAIIAKHGGKVLARGGLPEERRRRGRDHRGGGRRCDQVMMRPDDATR
jgi:uncharacterized protein (DUF1330 family)